MGSPRGSYKNTGLYLNEILVFYVHWRVLTVVALLGPCFPVITQPSPGAWKAFNLDELDGEDYRRDVEYGASQVKKVPVNK